VIAYLDTSAVIPLLVEEPGSAVCRDIWFAATTLTTSRLLYVEATAALARAARMGRLDSPAYEDSLAGLDGLWRQLDVIAVDEPLVREAAGLARTHGLRGYDAVHCASGLQVSGPDAVAVSGDQELLAAWRASGLPTVDTLG
jgi:uncharacterized protein